MSRATWTLQDSAAFVQFSSLAARLEPRRPQSGLSDLCWRGKTLNGHQMLAVDLSSAKTESADETLIDCYPRGSDLIATYAQTPERPARVQIYWRAAGFRLGDREAALVDLQVSVQTSLLDSHPRLQAFSRLPRGEVRRLVDANSGVFVPLSISASGPAVLAPEHGPGCLLFRWPQSEASYFEMIHPSDFGRDDLATCEDERLQLNHRLFSGSLEKGVILRARLRGGYLDNADDELVAAAAYREFLDSPPPLTT
jgi:hypothetical protein